MTTDRGAVTTQDLIDALEGSFFIYPAMPGMITPLSIPGIVGHFTPISHPEANVVGRARLTEERVDATIEQVKDIFRRKNKSFGWFVGPGSTPRDLSSRLTAAGLTLAREEAGMALTDLAVSVPSNPRVRVERAAEEDCKRAVPVVARATGMSEDVAAYVVDFFLALGAGLEVSMYLAYLEGYDEPVAFAHSIDVPHRPIMILQGAATLEEYRGQGIYSTLVGRRLRDARERGMEAAVIQAVRSTSAPIVEKAGFREVCALQLYAWDPPSEPRGVPADRAGAV